MWILIFLSLINVFSNSNFVVKAFKNVDINEFPIIGILTQEIHPNDMDYDFGLKNSRSENWSYIAASYVKYVEGAGARAIPIWIGKEESYYENILNKINGVLFPGGAALFNNTNGYSDAGMIIYKIAKRMNDNNIHFPLWGTCLGFELLSYLSSNGKEHRTHCSSSNEALNLKFLKGFRRSRLFGSAPRFVIKTLKTENVTPNYHHFCVTRKSLHNLGLDKQWKVLSVNNDENGVEFISSFEHFTYPFYGVQFHPEKNMYEWNKNQNNAHTFNGIIAAQYFANFFINESRKNQNHFLNYTEEENSLIYNYNSTYSGRAKGAAFQQMYIFPQNQSNAPILDI